MTSRTKEENKKHYDEYQSRPDQIRKRAKRNAARAEMVKAGKAHKGDGKDVAHKKSLSKGGSNAKSNLTMQSKKKNRGRRDKNGKTI